MALLFLRNLNYNPTSSFSPFQSATNLLIIRALCSKSSGSEKNSDPCKSSIQKPPPCPPRPKLSLCDDELGALDPSKGKGGGKCDSGSSIPPCSGMSDDGDSPNVPPSLAKIKALQERFQRNDGVPVFLKMGLRDQILYRLTMILVLVGLGSIAKMVFGMSFNK